MKRLIRAALLTYVIAFAGLFLLRHEFVLPFTDQVERPVGIKGLREMRISGTPELVVWVKKPRGNAPVVMFFGGNLGRLSSNVLRLEELALQGIGIAALGYRGSSGRAGEKSEAGFYEDAGRLYASLDALMGQSVPPNNRIAYGVSLGTGVASDLALRERLGGVVLETPYTRVCDVAFQSFPIFPTCLAMYDLAFNNIDKVAQIDAPLLVLHGTADQVIPYTHGQKVFEAANEPKRFVGYEGGRHNDLRLYGASQEILKFIRGL